MIGSLKPTPALKAAAPLLWRSAAFVGLFIAYSGLLGSRIIAAGIVGSYGFDWYGGIGKAGLFGGLALLLLLWRRDVQTKLRPWHPRLLLWLGLSVISFGLAWFCITKLLVHRSGFVWPAAVHVFLIASVLFALGGVFGPRNLRALAKQHKQQLYITFGLGTGFYVFMTAVYSLWEVLAGVVLNSVAFLLHTAGLSVAILPPRSLLLSKFGIEIAQFCSGIESMALFTALYLLIGVLDWRRLNHTKYIAVFPIALVILFGLNILRVFSLVLAGYYINPEFAFSLFHTYAGMVFFIVYSLIFWAISYRWMCRK